MTELHTHRVLLIEDDWDYANLIRSHLLRATPSIECLYADCMKAGIEQLRQEPVDLILLDLLLPDSPNSTATFDAVHTAAADIPLVVLTSVDEEQLAVDLLARGAQSYLVKSRSNRELILRTIQYAIDITRAERQFTQLEQLMRSKTNNLKELIEKSSQYALFLQSHLRSTLDETPKKYLTDLVGTTHSAENLLKELLQSL